MATTTTFQIGSYNGLTDGFTLTLDLNDRATYYLQSYDLGIPARADVRAFNIRTPGEVVERYQYKNATTTATVMVRAASTTALLAAVRSLVAAIEVPPYTLKVQLPGGTQVSYGDVLGVSYSIPSRPKEILAGALNKCVIHFERKPFWRGSRQWLHNLITNPGFESLSGTSVNCFQDTFANFNAYTLAQNAYRNEVMADGPLRYYRLGEASGTVAQDATNSGNNGTYVGSPTLGSAGAAGMGGDTAITLNGSTQYVSAATTSLPTTAAAWTLAVWCYITGNPAGTVTLSTYGLQSTAHGAPQITMNNLGQILVGDATSFTAASAALSLNTWHFIAATYDGTTIRAYIDGAAGNTVAATVATPASGTFATLGATAAASPAQFFPGRLDEAAFYNLTLSAARITTLYQIGLATFALGSLAQDTFRYPDTIGADSPARYLRLDDASGTTAIDASPNAQNGTYVAAPTLGVAGALTGDSDTAITLNGTTQKVTIPTTGLPIGNAAMSIECWIKFAANPAGNQVIISYGAPGTNHNALDLGIASTGKAFVDCGAGGTFQLNGAAALTLGAWHYLAVTWDGTTLSLYVDNAAVVTGTPGAQTIAASPPLTIGNTSGGSFWFAGSVDEMTFYSAALSGTRIAAHFTSGTTTPAATANTMAIPAEGRVSFGSPAWSALGIWQTRFRYTSSLTAATFHLHYTDASNQLYAQVTGTALTLVQVVSGVAHTLATTAITLVNGLQYWMRATQFPNPSTGSGNPVSLQMALYYDQNGTLVNQTSPFATAAGPTFDTVTALSGRPQITATGSALAVSAGATNHSVILFGLGNWFFTFADASATASAALALDSATTYPNGPVTSFLAARIDAPPAAAIFGAALSVNGGGLAGPTLIPAVPGNIMQFSAWTKSSGLGVNAVTRLEVYEYNAAGSQLRVTNLGSKTGNQASWTQMAGTITIGASTAFVDVQIHAFDTSAAGASANATVWVDNCQAWDQTRTGMTTMPYCEMGSSQSVSQLMISGLVGDVPAPALLMIGLFANPWNAGQTATVLLGRRAQSSANAQLIAPPVGYYGTGYAPQATAALDGVSYGGYYVQASVNNATTWKPRFVSALARDLAGTFHIYGRAQTADATPASVQARARIQQRQQAWFGLTTTTNGDLLNDVPATQQKPFSAANTWTLVDAGQVALPPAPNSLLADATKLYHVPMVEYTGSVGTAYTLKQNFLALMPVDGEVFAGTAYNPSGSGNNLSAQWLFLYWDGLAAAAGAPATAYSVESGSAGPVPNPAHGGGGPVGSSAAMINVVPAADSMPMVNPQITTPNSGGQGVNQYALIAQDNTGNLFSSYLEVIYSPLYTYPQ